MIITAVNILFIFVLVWWLMKLSPPYGKYWFSFAVAYKVLAGIALGLIYVYHLQSGDTLVFFNEALEISSIIDQSIPDYLTRLFSNEYPEYKGEYRTEFFSRILSIFLILTGENYWLTSVYLSLICFLGSWYLIITISNYKHDLKWPAFLAFMIVPSVVFWSSGILKDSLANAGFFYLCTFLIRYDQKKPISLFEHIGYALSLILVIKLRFYLGAIMIVSISYLVVWRFLSVLVHSAPVRYVLISTIMFGMIVATSFIDYNLQINHLPESIYSNYQSVIRSSESNYLTFEISPNWSSILINAPKSLLHGLFGPLPGQGAVSAYAYWVENTILIILFCWSVLLIIKHKSIPIIIRPTLIMTLAFILLLASALPLVAPNYGTLMRYKSIFLPFLWMIVLYLPFKKLKHIKSG